MPLSFDDRQFYDTACRGGVHPVTGMKIEVGSGCASIARQVLNHLDTIRFERGTAVADAMAKELGLMRRDA
jgi:hypothetical protein